MEETNDSDIYADLPKFRYFDGLDKLQATNKSLIQEIIQLNETLTKITKEKDEYQTKCATLTNNISSLLKTAQAEIHRKDKLIKELRDQIANSTKQNHYRKRSYPEEEASSHAKRINNSKDFMVEKSIIVDAMKLNESLDKISKENKKKFSENNDLSMCNNNNVKNAVTIPDPVYNGTNHTSRSNGEISNMNALLPPGGCKTLYSQRMFKKMHGLPVTNKSQEFVQTKSGDNQNITEEKNISGKDTFNAGNTKLVETNASKQPKDLDKRSISSFNAEVVDASNNPSLTNASNIINYCLARANKSMGDTSMLGIENDVKKYNDVRKSVEPAPNTDLQNAPFLINNTKNIVLDQKSKSLKALPLLELPSVENNFIKNEMNGLEVKNRTSENELFFRTVHSNQQNCEIKSQNLEESTKPIVNDIKNDTPKFLRPLSSTVIKKPSKRIILPVSNCWNGLVKTVDNVKEKKEGKEIRTTENIAPTSLRIKSSNSFNENKDRNQDKLTSSSSTTRPNNVLEDLFGSPLKWAENSNETTPLLELNSPTVYEDSCSAHIENAKFNLSSIKPAEQKPDTMLINHSTERNGINCKTIIEDRRQNEQLSTEKGITSVNTNKAERPFEEVGSIKQRMKSIFSPLKTDSCKSSASALNINTCSVDLTLKFPFKSKYEDSVLGQFDDTTQFFSALTKVESKLSPLNTPVKSLSKTVTSNTTLSSNMDHKSFSQVYQKLDCNEITSALNSVSNQKNFNEKPINILYPRKTPRIITYNKSNEEKSCTKQSSVVNDTPTKCNRFAINDAFISQQEEKVKRICKNNFNDPIAITICAKNKVKGKEFSTHHSPQGKGLQTCSPRKSKLSLSCLKKNRGTFTTIPTTQKKLSNDLNVVDLYNNGNEKPLQSQISNENSSYMLTERNSEKVAAEIPAKRNESVQKTEYISSTRHHNKNNTIDNDTEKINKKETFNDFTTHSVLDRRKSSDSLENVDELDNNVKEVYPNKSRTPNTNTIHGDCRMKNTENTTGILSENQEITVTKENSIRRDISKDRVNLPSEDTGHNQTIVSQSLNIKKTCEKIRFQNFKPSSQLKKGNKHSLQYKKQDCVKMIKNIPASLQEVSGTINVPKEFEISNYNERTPEKWKSNETESKLLNGNINKDRQRCCTSLKDQKKSPNIIIRSSKKPAFVSTTLSDDDFGSNTVIKSPDINCRNHNKVEEMKEWILKPITFDSDHRSCKKQRETDSQKEVPRTVKLDSNKKTSVSTNIGSKDITNKSNKFAASMRNSFNKVFSPNKKVILARRPMNFGVRVTLD